MLPMMLKGEGRVLQNLPSKRARYAVAVLSVLGASAARAALLPALGAGVPYITYFPAIILAALYGGAGPGILATVLSALCSIFWMEPIGSFQLDNFREVFVLALFLAISLLMVWICNLARRASEALGHSEQFNRSIIESSRDCIKVLDLKGNLLTMNERGQMTLGIADLQKYLHKPYLDFWQGEYREAAQAAVEQATSGGEGHYLGFFPTFEGEPKWWDVQVTPILDAKGKPVRLLAVSRDVTEHMEAEEQLRESEERSRLAIHAGNVGTWDWDIAENRVTWSERIYEFHGLQQGGFGGKVEDFAALIYPEDRERAQAAVTAALQNRQPYEIEMRVVRPTGEVRWISTSGRVVFDSSGKAVRMLGATVDVTERKRAEEERERLLEREKALRAAAEEANRLKDEFLATVSHELRTPLNAILGWATMLRARGNKAEFNNRAAEIIERNAKYQNQLIEDILDASRIITGKLRLNIATVSLVSVVDNVIDSMRPALEGKRILLKRNLDTGIEQVSGDAARLQQVVWNLLSNAVKFTPEDGEIEISLNCRDAYAELAVRDTGTGISPDFLPFVFDRFRQADGSTTRKYGGLGLGLAIVRHLVEMHGGSVYAESQGEGKGTTFTITIPLRSRHTEVESPSSSEEISKTGPPLSALKLNGVRVLVVDDQVDACALVSEILSQDGAAVTIAYSVAEALERLGEATPDLIISDIAMPEVDGYSLIYQARSLYPQIQNIPAIALTALAREEDKARALAAGYQLYIPKPVQPEELLQAVTTILNMNRAGFSAS